jgi:hypothetical protein
MKKIISFSLWGNSPKYLIGALKNADLAKEFYRDWECHFYCNKDVPTDLIESLREKPNAKVHVEDGDSDWTFSTKRLFPMSEEGVERVIFRDTDSRIGSREVAAVREWEKAGLDAHIMRDHPHHGGFPILAGMFGIKGGVIKNIKKLLELNKNVKMQYHYDQIFLAKFVYPFIEDSVVVHDEFFNNKPFPTKREGLSFVGQVFDEHDETVPEHLSVLKESLENES